MPPSSLTTTSLPVAPPPLFPSHHHLRRRHRTTLHVTLPRVHLPYCRLGISYAKQKGLFPVVVSCLVEDNSQAFLEPEGSIEANPGATIDLKLPRRSLLVQFTCNACGVRSQKLINRLAYEKGMVFVQCTGCSQYHKLVDNLNLVVEYDFREETNTSSDEDQV